MDRSAGDGTVGKALDVLELVAQSDRPVRFAELLSQSPHPKATLYRLLQTLRSQGMVSYEPETGSYSLGVRLVRLAHAAWRQSSLGPIAGPFLDRLASEIGETVHLAQLDCAQVLYVAKRTAPEPIEMYSSAGKVGPAYCTGVGKALLAFQHEDALASLLSQQSFHRFTNNTLTTETALRAELEEIRSQGFAVDREEHEPGIVCVAAPILSERATAMGAISITSKTTRMDLDSLATYAPRVVQMSCSIAEAARDWSFPAARSR